MTDPAPASPYLTTDEVAALLRKSRDYVSRQCAAGNLRGKKLGNEWRIHRDEIARFMTPQAPVAQPARRRRAL